MCSKFVEENYDVVVVGAGHAGCEAALACATTFSFFYCTFALEFRLSRHFSKTLWVKITHSLLFRV